MKDLFPILIIVVGIMAVVAIGIVGVWFVQGAAYDECNQPVKPDFPLECYEHVSVEELR